MILELSGKFPVKLLCKEMGIERSSFYYWKIPKKEAPKVPEKKQILIEG